jgi:peptide-methionine (S)-S-oxide reductase
VIRTRVGYEGGQKDEPTYRSLGDHTESIEIDYDPEKISYADLLDVFWKEHNPMRPAFSRQYASIIFYHNDEQKAAAEASKKEREDKTGRKIFTELIPHTRFWRAEDYHQKYYLRGNDRVFRDYANIFDNDDAFTDSTSAARANGYIGGHGSIEQLEAELPLMGISEDAGEVLTRIVKRGKFGLGIF